MDVWEIFWPGDQHEMNQDEKKNGQAIETQPRTSENETHQERWLSKTNRLFPVVQLHEIFGECAPKIISDEICFDLCLFSYFTVARSPRNWNQ